MCRFEFCQDYLLDSGSLGCVQYPFLISQGEICMYLQLEYPDWSFVSFVYTMNLGRNIVWGKVTPFIASSFIMNATLHLNIFWGRESNYFLHLSFWWCWIGKVCIAPNANGHSKSATLLIPPFVLSTWSIKQSNLNTLKIGLKSWWHMYCLPSMKTDLKFLFTQIPIFF